MNIKKELFGKLKTGEEVYKYSLKNKFLKIGILNYGGIIAELYMPDKNGYTENIVLGFDNLNDYEAKSPYFGCITGRHAGRIKNATFSIGNTTYTLDKNDGANNLHGGYFGMDKKLWDVKILDSGLELSYFSPHLEGGFPADLNIKVRYILNEDILKIQYEAIPDRETIVNLTNHTYFNLSGGRETIEGHKLFIDSDYFMELTSDSIVTGNKLKVENTPFDFKKMKDVGRDIDKDFNQLKLAGGYDHPFVLNPSEQPQIVLCHLDSGRKIEINTTEETVVFYSGNYLKDEGLLNNNIESKQHLGLCLETQQIPNKVNLPEYSYKFYSKENIYKSETKYRFSLV
ncbi:aldose epimerase family protein [uncultured Ilyobacter sp.]|uniref:aldose epimerase family protein n=1 Tax=uncultured Ilyobacter sp. TaxID=544433 RepID=UPI0029C730E7|nr:aldose epimerase family protein [uncultured Ilyobacter sp.]